ncbi:MAG: DUF4956 domain-containing protein [Bacilli bacterium]|nr:DUF4956 domain-containing protein [Bacilli bacterium]
MSFSDIFKKNFLENFSGNISIELVIMTLLFALIFSIIVFFVYKLTSKNTIYSKNFNITMSLISIVTASVVLSMQANIVVSLGMVGALSIVRFRTAIKEPRDLLFLFWSISNGIIIGAGIYSIVFILAIIITIGLIGFDLIPNNRIPYLLVVNTSNQNVYDKIINVLNENLIKYKLKSRTMNKNYMDIVFEVACKDSKNLYECLSKVNGITSFNILSQDGECQF